MLLVSALVQKLCLRQKCRDFGLIALAEQISKQSSIDIDKWFISGNF